MNFPGKIHPRVSKSQLNIYPIRNEEEEDKMWVKNSQWTKVQAEVVSIFRSYISGTGSPYAPLLSLNGRFLYPFSLVEK